MLTPNAFPSFDLYHDAVDLFRWLAEAEFDLVANVLSDPARSMPVVEAAGVTADLFTQPDLRIVFLAADLGRTRPKITILRVAREALRQENYWNAAGAFGRSIGFQWSNESLAGLADRCFFCTSAIERAAAVALDLAARLRRAHDLITELRGTLIGTMTPPPSVTTATTTTAAPRRRVGRPAFVVLPNKGTAA